MSSPHRVLILGAGVTGSLTAAVLRRKFKQHVDLIVWDKARGAGGRMATKRQPDQPGLGVDTGAQYISTTTEFYDSHRGFYDELLSSSVLVRFDGTIEGAKGPADVRHFVAPQGINSVPKYFLESAGASVHFRTHCHQLNLVTVGTNNQQWQAIDLSGQSLMIDTVIVTIPVPQLLSLAGSIQQVLADKRKSLEEVCYSSRYALALYYKPGTNIDISWTAKYIDDNPCVRFVCVDSAKKGKDPKEFGASILVHTSVPFGIQHLDREKEEVEQIILHHFKQLLPDIPQPAMTHCHRWRYSQVLTAFDGTPGCVIINECPLLLVGGDAFVQHSNFDGCVESSLSLVEKFSELNGIKSPL